MDYQSKFQDDGAQKSLIDYPLSLDSIVFDVGGYLGEWTQSILDRGKIVCNHCGARQDPYVYLFEPVNEYYESCVKRFKDNPKVVVLPFGLSNFDRFENFSVEGSSSHSDRNGNRPVVMKDIAQFCYDSKITRIDLISINIEGGEYALLDRMIRSGIASMCQNIQVQFHSGHHKSSQETRQHLLDMLSETHDVKFSYPFIWEAFTKKS